MSILYGLDGSLNEANLFYVFALKYLYPTFLIWIANTSPRNTEHNKEN